MPCGAGARPPAALARGQSRYRRREPDRCAHQHGRDVPGWRTPADRRHRGAHRRRDRPARRAGGEGLQVLNYKPGGEYQPHFDFFNPQASRRSAPVASAASAWPRW
jgi:hypothetical protein